MSIRKYKACKDCKFLVCVSTASYASFDHIPEGYLICRPPIKTGHDVIYGDTRRAQYAPRSARMNDELCGLDAKWFEPKPE